MWVCVCVCVGGGGGGGGGGYSIEIGSCMDFDGSTQTHFILQHF